MRSNTKKYLALLDVTEAKYYKRLLNVSKFVYSSFLYDLKNHGLDTAKANLRNVVPSEDLHKILEGIYSEAGLKGARLAYNELRATLKQEEKAGGFGRNARWIGSVLNYLKVHILEFAQSITETMKEDILAELSKVVQGEYTIDQVVEAIQNSKRPRARARVIARTEVVRAANVGHAAGAKEFPFEVNKKWVAAKDHRTRDSHRLVNNHVVDENGFFSVPLYKNGKPTGITEQMLYPGDAKASAANTINCRCRIVHEPKRDSQGNLIRRSTTSATVIPLRATPAQQLPLTGIAAIRKALSEAVFVGVKDSE